MMGLIHVSMWIVACAVARRACLARQTDFGRVALAPKNLDSRFSRYATLIYRLNDLNKHSFDSIFHINGLDFE